MKLLYGDRYSVDMDDTVTYITVDPAGGTAPKDAGPRSDKWGFTVNAVSTDEKWFIMDMFAEHLTEAMFVEKLFELDALWHPYRIGVEKTQHLEAYMRLAFARKNQSLPVVELRPRGRRKASRITALSAMLPNIYFNSKIAATMQHMMRRWYTDQEHGDDALDSLAYQIDIARAPTPGMLIENRKLKEAAVNTALLSRLPPDQQGEWKAWLEYEKRLKHGNSLSEELMDMYNY